MEESERLYQEVQRGEAIFPLIEEEKVKMIEDRELHRLLIMTIAAEKLLDPNDRKVADLRKQIEERKRAFFLKVAELNDRLNGLKAQLASLTAPVIEKGISQLRREIQDLTVERKKVGRFSGHMSMINYISVETNEDGVLLARKTAKMGIEGLRRMSLEPIAKIRLFIDDQLEALQAIDLAPIVKNIPEEDYARQEFLNSPANR